MKYAQCKCGERKLWTTMGIKPCLWCEKCQTTPAYGPEGHKTERPKHKILKRSDEQLERALAGAKSTAEALAGHPEQRSALGQVESIEKDLMICGHCMKSLRDIEKNGEPHEPWAFG
jgi:hypothetical protein